MLKRPRNVLKIIVPFAIAANAFCSVAVSAPPSGAGYSLIYQEEFNGSALDSSQWYHRITLGKYTEGYMRAGNVSVEGGLLRLRYDYEDFNNDGVLDFTGGGILSRNLFGYGYYETRAKLFDAVSGLHTSFWSMGVRPNMPGATGDPDIQADIDAKRIPLHNQFHEVDGFEHNSAAKLGMGTIKQAQQTTQSRFAYRTEAELGALMGEAINFADWNTYGYEISPDYHRFYINGHLLFEIPSSQYPFQYGPMNFWLTSLPYTPNSNSSVLPGYSEFDYFKFYARHDTAANRLGNAGFDARPLNNPDLQIVTGWIENYDDQASMLVWDEYVDATRSLKHEKATSYLVTTKQNLQFIPNGNYRLTAYVKSSGGQQQCAMRVLNYGGAERVYNIPATASWTQITIDNVQVTNQSATIAFTSNASGGQWLRVDKVAFQEM
ncbi:glycoside hydrolase family 16 protein [Peristeroidobacter soli]|uniref:glycoside hydrolase family 16 protein n=1 Tax=Peristeroidobacter soli TaxID=2497877 RepID=UPI00101BCD54|nr:glycoside hydrolase family 16 protein [Peristeroidobacter soli]